jgi:formate hydrogenlyase subunit 3/multisubunit Na+/H+ antiporter MnhD subunit
MTLTAALRYILFALIGSALYLLGTALLYGNYGTLDISLSRSGSVPGQSSGSQWR